MLVAVALILLGVVGGVLSSLYLAVALDSRFPERRFKGMERFLVLILVVNAGSAGIWGLTRNESWAIFLVAASATFLILAGILWLQRPTFRGR